jgi:acetoin utilization deacetylase AcuC-like enzyme
MAAAMRDLAAELDTGVLVCLEGGYSPPALAASVVETIAALDDGRSPWQASPEAAEPHLTRLRDQAVLDV